MAALSERKVPNVSYNSRLVLLLMYECPKAMFCCHALSSALAVSNGFVVSSTRLFLGFGSPLVAESLGLGTASAGSGLETTTGEVEVEVEAIGLAGKERAPTGL